LRQGSLTGREGNGREGKIREGKGREKKDKDIVGSRPPTIPYSKIIDHLNEKNGSSFRADTDKTKRLIKARFREGWKFEDFVAVIDSKVFEWGTDESMMQYIRPETLFGTKFESYLNGAKLSQGSIEEEKEKEDRRKWLEEEKKRIASL